MESGIVEDMSFNKLPEGCIAKILSNTSPKDAGRLSVVSPMFRSASDSDVVWETFLPVDHKSIISQSNSSLLLETASSKKQLYLNLCDSPILVDDGKKRFSLEKSSGKICYMISARDLIITWGATPQYWKWTSNPSSRFAEVAQLMAVCWLEIRGKISTCALSPATMYTAYLVYKLSAEAYGLDSQPVEVTMKLDGVESRARTVGWNTEIRKWLLRRPFGLFNFRRRRSVPARASDGRYLYERRDGWLEIELIDFFSKEGEDEELEIRVLDDTRHWKCGLIVDGIEIRPNDGARESCPGNFKDVQDGLST